MNFCVTKAFAMPVRCLIELLKHANEFSVLYEIGSSYMTSYVRNGFNSLRPQYEQY